VICASGQRAATAASLAQLHGAEDVWHVVDGGVGTWGRAGFELERPA
jgi:hydroxyacylglutathione hydrolase